MSPRRAGSLTMPSSFPRVSGDEPAENEVHGHVSVFSPRERG